MPRQSGFTLIELLVVITIIVVLLALLVPAMDKAIYQAELAVCGANVKAIGGGATLYAMDFKRSYPHRPGIHNTDGVGQSWRDNSLATFIPGQPRYDDRPTIEQHIPLKSLLCPLGGGEFDIANPDPISQVYANYSLWFGWKFQGSESGMTKVGNRFSFTAPDGTRSRFDVLASDEDIVSDTGGGVLSAHADKDKGRLTSKVYDHEIADLGLQWAFSRWEINGVSDRGDVDCNFVHADGSVRRITDIPVVFADDDRLRIVTAFNLTSTPWKTALPPAQ